MSVIAIKRPLLALSEVISYNHVAICWSQTPFTVHAPTTEVLSFIQGNGKPPVQMVWKHLDHLADMAPNLQEEHIAGFLHDLHCTYTYLQDHTEESRSYFDLRRSKEVWLNITSSEGEQAVLADVKSSWNEIRDLVLSSSYDSGRVKAVRPGLRRYEKLLRALGCRSIVLPTVARPVLHHDHSVSASLQALRTKKKLLDITYCTQGKEIQAHRVVLAAVSEKCARQWSGLFPVEDRIVFDQNLDPDCFLSYHTLSTMIDFAYEGEIDWSEMEASDDDDEDTKEEKLQMLLELHKGAQFWLIPALMSKVEKKILGAGNLFINIKNVVETWKQAEYVGAKAVAEWCDDFIKGNHEVVERASDGILE
jgi:sacsin